MARGALELALGDGAEPAAKVEPYQGEMLPLPAGWLLTDVEFGAGSGGTYSQSPSIDARHRF
jgi:hypothetical protein